MSESTIGIIFLVLTNLIALGASVLSLVRSSKLLPKELEEATLEVKEREIGLAEKYESMMQKSIEDKEEITGQLFTLERAYGSLKDVVAEKLILIEEQGKKILYQGNQITELVEKIKAQDNKIRNQNTKIRKQASEITNLTQQLDRMERYNCALIQQMKKLNIMPIDITEINGDEYIFNGDSEVDEE